MSPVPDFILELRRLVGDLPLWLPGVTAVIRRGDEVLLVRRADNGAWTPVTGITDPGEEPAVTAAREALEETGTRIRVDRLAATSVHPEVVYDNGDRAAYLDLTFACTWLEGEAHVADDESSDVRWWPLSSLPEMNELMLWRIDAATSDEREARFAAPAGAGGRRSTAGARARRSRARRRRLPRRLGRRGDRPRPPDVGLHRVHDHVAGRAGARDVRRRGGRRRHPDRPARQQRPARRRRGAPRAGRQGVVDLLHPDARCARGPHVCRGSRGQRRRHRRHQRQRPGVRAAREGPAGRRVGARAPRRRGRRGAPRAELRPDGGRAGAGEQEGRRRRTRPA